MAGRGYRPVQARRGAAALTLLGSVKRCCHVNAVDDRQVSRAAGDCASPACQASWVSSVRGPWCGTPNSGEGNEDVRPCSNTECAASALLLCASCTLCSLWVWGTFWTVGRLSLFGCLLSSIQRASMQRLLESQTAVPQSVGTVANKPGGAAGTLCRGVASRSPASSTQSASCRRSARPSIGRSTAPKHTGSPPSRAPLPGILLSSCDQTYGVVTVT